MILMMMVTTLLVTLIQIWVNNIYDNKSPFCKPLVFFWENTCKTLQELSGHYDCHALRFSIVRNVNNFTTSLGLPFEGWSGDVQSIRSKQIIIHLGPSGLLSIDCKSLLVFAWYSMVLDGPETPESHWYYWNVPGWLALHCFWAKWKSQNLALEY